MLSVLYERLVCGECGFIVHQVAARMSAEKEKLEDEEEESGSATVCLQAESALLPPRPAKPRRHSLSGYYVKFVLRAGSELT